MSDYSRKNRNENEETFYPPRKEKFPSKKEKKQSLKKEIISTLWQIALIFFLLLGVRHFLFVPVSVEGNSMEPTLHDHNRLLLSKMGKPERFDVIVFPAPDSPDKQYIKRVIGLPGDSVRMEADQLFINGEKVDEYYLGHAQDDLQEWETYTNDFSLETLTGKEVVPEDSFFVMGDNRPNSKDSRVFGFVPIESIFGKTEWRLWPLKEFGRIDPKNNTSE